MAIVLICFAFIVLFFLLIDTVRLGIGPTSASYRVRKTFYQILPDEVHGTIYELGCGWGFLIPLLRKRYPNHDLIAYEYAIVPYLVACLLNAIFRWHVCIRFKNFYQSDFEGAGLIVCYLFPKAMQQLSKKLKSKCAQSFFIISINFFLPSYKEEKILYSTDWYCTPIYCYFLN